MATCFLVLGTPRSGTSCVAGVLHYLGVPMGETLFPPCEMNAKGSFQDLDFEGCFDRLQTHIPEVLDKSLVAWNKFSAITQKRCSGGDWGAKFRMAAVVLPEFKQICSHDIRLIITKRNPQQSVSSLSQWCPAEYQDSQEIIDRATAAVEAVERTTDLPILSIDFEELMSAPLATVERIAEFVGRDMTQAAAEFIDPAMRRHF